MLFRINSTRFYLAKNYLYFSSFLRDSVVVVESVEAYSLLQFWFCLVSHLTSTLWQLCAVFSYSCCWGELVVLILLWLGVLSLGDFKSFLFVSDVFSHWSTPRRGFPFYSAEDFTGRCPLSKVWYPIDSRKFSPIFSCNIFSHPVSLSYLSVLGFDWGPKPCLELRSLAVLWAVGLKWGSSFCVAAAESSTNQNC